MALSLLALNLATTIAHCPSRLYFSLALISRWILEEQDRAFFSTTS
jgi:hypothetical protein